MSDTTKSLRALIDQYLSGQLALPAFWQAFNATYAESDDSEFTDAEYAYFSDVNDHLHHADWTSPAEPGLEDPGEFRAWLASVRNSVPPN